jgi:hypothetical protein
MTESPGVIRGTYSDLKIVKTRRVFQVVIELPLEQFSHAMEVLGGAPLPDREVWVAVARLNERALPTTPHRATPAEAAVPDTPSDPAHSYPRRNWSDLSPAERAAICCRDVRFQYWLKQLGRIPLATEAEATAYVQRVAGGSRSNLGKPGNEGKTKIWETIDHKFAEYLSDLRKHGDHPREDDA